MVSGYKTLNEIERSISDLRAREKKLRSDQEVRNGEHAALLERRTQLFRELAEVRVQHAVADGVIDHADQLHHRIEAILKARQKSIDDFKEREKLSADQRVQLVEVADALHVDIVRLEGELDAVADRARAELEQDEDFRALQKQAVEARDVFLQADAKTERSETDRKRKGQSYENDPLFMYLWKRQYGSSDYGANSIIELLDGWVARLVGYHDARANYALLQEIPERLRAHCDQLDAVAKDFEEQLDKIQAKHIEALAGAELLQEIQDVRYRQSQNTESLDGVDAELSELGEQLRRYGDGSDPSFQEARKLAAGFLEHESMERLLELARSTVQPTDDQIVTQIGQIDGQLDRLKRQVLIDKEELTDLMERREELVKAASQFRRRHYDDPGSEFDFDFEMDDFVEDMLEEFLKGAISGAGFGRRGRGRQRWTHRPADSFRRGAGMPPFGRGGGGRGSRGGGGDFRTGGGF